MLAQFGFIYYSVRSNQNKTKIAKAWITGWIGHELPPIG
jgi:hypothetical protein